MSIYRQTCVKLSKVQWENSEMQPPNVKSVLAVGENFEYALFRIAISFAEKGLHVWFISPETFEKAPRNIKPPDKEILQLITFMYLKDIDDLIRQLNGIHMWHKTPNVIILTKFERYCNFNAEEYNPLRASLLSTSLLDSAAVCTRKKSSEVFLLVTCAKLLSNKIDKLQIIKDLYFSNYICKNEDDEFVNTIVQLLNQ